MIRQRLRLIAVQFGCVVVPQIKPVKRVRQKRYRCLDRQQIDRPMQGHACRGSETASSALAPAPWRRAQPVYSVRHRASGRFPNPG